MAAEKIASCKRKLQDDLAEVLAVLDFATAAFRTYALSGRILGGLAGQHDLYRQVEEFRTSTRLTDLENLLRALYVQIWSAFELSLRSLTINYVEECCDKASDFDFLDRAKIVERNLFHSGVALQLIFENRSHLDLKFFEIAKNIGTSVPGSQKVVINAATFTLFGKGPSVSGIEDAMKRIGLGNFNWDALGRTPEVQKAFGARGNRETVKQLKSFLSDAERIRNHIVHRGEKIQPVGESDLRDHATKFQAVSFGLAGYLTEALERLK